MFTTRVTARLINRISKCNNLHTNRKYKNINQNNQNSENLVKDMQKELSEIKNINREILNIIKPIESNTLCNKTSPSMGYLDGVILMSGAVMAVVCSTSVLIK